MKHHHRKSSSVIILLISVIFLVSCTPPPPLLVEVVENHVEEALIPQALEVTVTMEKDPSLLDKVLSDPYLELLDVAKESLFPDEKLYNDFYHALREGVETFDVSEYDLSHEKKHATLDAMYSTVGIELFHVHRMYFSKDGNEIRITYSDTIENFNRMNKIYYARLAHAVYNVPQGPTEIERYFSVYDHLSRISSYTDDMDDDRTFTASSILLHGKGICGGYSMLNQHILKQMGIRSLYLMNEPHAWNMVTLEGVDYITDLTWGAGTAGSDENSLRHILTSTEERNRTLIEYGYGGSPVYTGFYSDEMILAEEPENNQFSHLYDLYTSYALDTKNGHLYYSDVEGIHRIDLSGENKKTISDHSGEQLVYFDDALYYISLSDSYLYKVTEGQVPQVIHDTYLLGRLALDKGVLNFSEIGEEGRTGTIDLNRYQRIDDNSDILEETTLRKEDTMKFVLQFSSPMEPEGSFQAYIGLLDENQQIIPFNYLWSDDGKTLTLRSAESLSDFQSLTLKISKEIHSMNDEHLTDSLEFKMDILD